jgi:hypothetical protein
MRTLLEGNVGESLGGGTRSETGVAVVNDCHACAVPVWTPVSSIQSSGSPPPPTSSSPSADLCLESPSGQPEGSRDGMGEAKTARVLTPEVWGLRGREGTMLMLDELARLREKGSNRAIWQRTPRGGLRLRLKRARCVVGRAIATTVGTRTWAAVGGRYGGKQ